MKKAIIYTRVACTEQGGKDYSLQHQEDQLRNDRRSMAIKAGIRNAKAKREGRLVGTAPKVFIYTRVSTDQKI